VTQRKQTTSKSNEKIRHCEPPATGAAWTWLQQHALLQRFPFIWDHSVIPYERKRRRFRCWRISLPANRIHFAGTCGSRAFSKFESYRHAPRTSSSRNGFAVVAGSIAQAMRLEGWPQAHGLAAILRDAALCGASAPLRARLILAQRRSRCARMRSELDAGRVEPFEAHQFNRMAMGFAVRFGQMSDPTALPILQ
jgi:hypothetical protein